LDAPAEPVEALEPASVPPVVECLPPDRAASTFLTIFASGPSALGLLVGLVVVEVLERSQR